MFTPVGAIGRLPSVPTAKRRRSVDTSTTGYCDYVVPLKDEDATQRTTPLRSPDPPMRTARFTFNPFTTATGIHGPSDQNGSRHHFAGDAFGPAVPSLNQWLQGDHVPPPPTLGQSVSSGAPSLVSFPPSPTKAVLPSKLKPSMIPRLVLAPPPPPKPQSNVRSPSPTKSSFTGFFASPVKGSTSGHGRTPSTVNKAGPPRFASGKAFHPSAKKIQAKTNSVNRQTTLSVEAQASLANLSVALEKLSMPRPRTSLSSSTSSSEGSGTKSEEEEKQARLDELPPRPSTSLGVRSVHEDRRAENVLRRRDGMPTRQANVPTLQRRASASSALNAQKGKGTFLDPNEVLAGRGEECEAVPSSLKGKEKEREPLATIGGISGDALPESDCLAGCVIFVDVRTDEGSDAGAMFVQMLKRLSAKVINRPGTTATHYVWKSGLQSTLTRHSAMAEPRPHLVGIGWVVQCVERKQKVDEKKFLVNVKEAELHFGTKRRKSLQVKDRSAMVSGLVPARGPPQRTVSNPNPLIIRTASTSNRPPTVKVGGVNKVAHRRVPFAKPRVPAPRPAPRPSPVKEVAETQEVEVEVEEVPPPSPEVETHVPPSKSEAAVGQSTPPSAFSRSEDADKSSSSSQSEASASERKKPMFSLVKSKRTPPPLQLQAQPTSGSRKNDPLADFSEMLAETQTSLLAEAQETQLERARRRSLLFAPKVSSPLKKNFRVF